MIGAHTQGYNAHSTGISIIGSFTAEQAPDAALDAVARLIGWKLPWHGAPVIGTHVLISGGGAANRYRYGTQVSLQRINGHRDGDSTACPGNKLYAQLPDLRSRTAALAGAPIVSARVALAGPSAVAYGGAAELTGTVTDATGAPQPGIEVRIEKQGVSGRWSTIARTTTGPEGRFSVAPAWKRAGIVRAMALKTPSPPLDISLIPLLDVRADSSAIVAGGSAVLRGTVRPSGRVSVLIERRSAGRWKRVTVATLQARSSFSVRRRLVRPGTYRLTASVLYLGRTVSAAPVVLRVGGGSGARVGGASA